MSLGLLPKIFNISLESSQFQSTLISSGLSRVVYISIYGAPIKPRVHCTLLLCGKLHGGLGVPNLLRYDHDAQLAQLMLYHATFDYFVYG